MPRTRLTLKGVDLRERPLPNRDSRSTMSFNKLSPRRLAILTLTAALLLLVTACLPDRPQSTFGPEGKIARDQLHLFQFIFWIAVIVFVAVEGVLVYFIFKYRRKAGDTTLPPQIHGNNRLEIAWTILPVFILAAIAIPTYRTIADHKDPPEGDALKVEVIGHQWWWEFRYPDLGVVTANEMHIPINKTVVVDLESQDVIHSFWIPKLAGKTDVVPGRINVMWLVADKEGNYYGQCAELCGLAHAQMRFRVISHTQENFDKWVKGQTTAPPQPAANSAAARGAQTFVTKGCLACHTISGPDAPGVQEGRAQGFEQGRAVFPAPNLAYFGDRGTMAAGLFDLTEDRLAKWLQDPDELKPGNRMAELAQAYADPGSKLSDADIEALVAYLMSRQAVKN